MLELQQNRCNTISFLSDTEMHQLYAKTFVEEACFKSHNRLQPIFDQWNDTKCVKIDSPK